MRTNLLRRCTAVAIAAAVTFVGAAGCSANSDPNSSNPQPNETNAPAPSSPNEDSEVKIEHPKDLAAVADTCQLLKPEQVEALGTTVQPEKQDSMLGGTRCRWAGPELFITITPDTSNGHGAAEIVKSQESAEKAQVGEYPAVHVDRQSRLCRVKVGISDTQSFAVNFTRGGAQNPEMMDACAYGDKIASEVLKNIPDAQPK